MLTDRQYIHLLAKTVKFLARNHHRQAVNRQPEAGNAHWGPQHECRAISCSMARSVVNAKRTRSKVWVQKEAK